MTSTEQPPLDGSDAGTEAHYHNYQSSAFPGMCG